MELRTVEDPRIIKSTLVRENSLSRGSVGKGVGREKKGQLYYI